MPTEHSVSGFVIWWFPFYYFSVETIPPLLEGGKEEKHPGIRVLPGTIQSPPPVPPQCFGKNKQGILVCLYMSHARQASALRSVPADRVDSLFPTPSLTAPIGDFW